MKELPLKDNGQLNMPGVENLKQPFITDGTLLLLPIAKELCPKMAEKLAYYKGMEYALQGTILVEIRMLKARLKRLNQFLADFRNTDPELFKRVIKTGDLNI